METLEKEPARLARLRADLILCDFVYAIDLPAMDGLSMQRKLATAFPELQWEDCEGAWERISLRAKSREELPRTGIYLLCKEPPAPCRLSISLRATEVARADELRRVLLARMITALGEAAD
jgi:hypothetical protein